uniref:Transmembrane 9 superfamily member n=1 Tax=Oryza punctata TaxID=4537 RepID=A0A0E0LHV7_ORYPU
MSGLPTVQCSRYLANRRKSSGYLAALLDRFVVFLGICSVIIGAIWFTLPRSEVLDIRLVVVGIGSGPCPRLEFEVLKGRSGGGSESDIKWASRWDSYLLMTDDQIHRFSIVNSLMIVLFLSGMLAMIMLRTLYRDISKYNQLETQEETGWKLVHGDVFRPPARADLLCVFVGTGVQFLGMLLVTLLFAILGLLSPSNKGGLMTAMLLVWAFMGVLAGYAAARLGSGGSEWKTVAMKTTLAFPGVAFAVFFVLNALIWGDRSSGTVPFTTMTALLLFWFGISVPLVFVGSYLGFKRMLAAATEDYPVRTNKIPRPIPEQPWYMNPVMSLFFILTSIWLHQFYYIFGFVFLVFAILAVTCTEIAVVLCYFQLCGEDYEWWWRSYLTAGSSALYLFLYAAFYFFTKLDITKESQVHNLQLDMKNIMDSDGISEEHHGQ